MAMELLRILMLVLLCADTAYGDNHRSGGNAVKRIDASASIQPLHVISWNIRDFGGRKSLNLDAVAGILQDGDIATIQEVVAGPAGRARLVELDRKLEELTGAQFCTGLSKLPSDSDERFGFVWRHSRIYLARTASGKRPKLMRACPGAPVSIELAAEYATKIIREPALALFYSRSHGKLFALASLHLVPTAKKPRREIEPTFKAVDAYEKLANPGMRLPMIVAGDFNLGPNDTAFKRFARGLGFAPVLQGQATSLKMKKRLLNKPYDNFWTRNIHVAKAKVHDLYKLFPKLAIKEIYYGISDHAPISAYFTFQDPSPDNQP